MIINIEKNNNTIFLKLEGRLDSITSPQLESEINGVNEYYKELVIDMSKLEYISNEGICVLLSAKEKMSRTGRLKLISTNEIVVDLLKKEGLNDTLVVQ